MRERGPSPRMMKSDQPFSSRGISAIKEDPDMLDSELSVSLHGGFFNPFNASCSKLLLFEGLLYLIFDIRALSPERPNVKKLKIVGSTSMAKCKALTGSVLKRLIDVLAREILIGNFVFFFWFYCTAKSHFVCYGCFDRRKHWSS